MTLQVLRNRVGDDAFSQIARQWVQERGGGTGTTAQFIALAERVSGQQLDDLFDAWLFSGSKPTVTTPGGPLSGGAAGGSMPPRYAPGTPSSPSELSAGRY